MADITLPAELVQEKIPNAAEGTLVSLSVELGPPNEDGTFPATIDPESVMVGPPGEESEAPPESPEAAPPEEPEAPAGRPAAVAAVMKVGPKRGKMPMDLEE